MGTSSKKQHKYRMKTILGVGIPLLVILLVIFLFSYKNSADTNNIQESMSKAIKQYVLGEPETSEGMSYGEDFIQFGHSFTLDVLAQNACYEITEIQVNGDVADVELTIASPDVPAIVQKIMEKHTISSSDELISLLEVALGECNLTKQYSVHVTLKKVNGKWKLIENYDFLNAIYGGILEEGNQIIEDLTIDIVGGKQND